MSKENLTNFFQSLFILYKCKDTNSKIWNRMQKDTSLTVGLDSDDIPLINHIILETVNFLEEYNNYFQENKHPNFEKRIRDVKIICKPIIKKINKWNLKDFRNRIVAHPWRENGKFINPESTYFNVPRSAIHCLLLVNYVNYIWSIIEAEFESEFQDAITYILNIATNKNSLKDLQAINEEQLEMVEKVNLKCSELSKNYFLKVFLYKID